MLGRARGLSLADLARTLPRTWITPTLSAPCADDRKYQVAAELAERYVAYAGQGLHVAGQTIAGITTVNGIRFSLAGGSWGLVRASSNKPEIVVVCESPVSRQMMQDVLAHIRAELEQSGVATEF
jgi:phosphomannomutase / phosphoglucomutase